MVRGERGRWEETERQNSIRTLSSFDSTVSLHARLDPPSFVPCPTLPAAILTAPPSSSARSSFATLNFDSAVRPPPASWLSLPSVLTLSLPPVRPLTEAETKVRTTSPSSQSPRHMVSRTNDLTAGLQTLFSKLANYIGSNLVHLVDTPDDVRPDLPLSIVQ